MLFVLIFLKVDFIVGGFIVLKIGLWWIKGVVWIMFG